MARILLVDDAAFMRKVIKDTLSKAGYTDLHEAVDGADAVEKYNSLKPDLVLMDQETMVIDAIRSGAKDFIVKPFKGERVLKTVTSIVGEP